MQQNEHLINISGLNRVTQDLPTVATPFRKMVDSAVTAIRLGDKRFTPVDQIVFGKLNALADAEQLDSQNWEIIRSDGNTLIISNDFLRIQDDSSQLDRFSTGWNSERTKNALKRYVDIFSAQRQSHILVLEQSFSALEENNDADLVKKIREVWAKEKGFSTYEDVRQNFLTSNRLIAIPWVDDSPYVWQDVLKIPKELTDRYSTVKKINEIGLIFTSKQFRGTEPPSHDYFSYAGSLAKQRGVTIEDIFLLTASHEGSHGPIESMTTLIAGIPELSFISEGFPSVFGNDRRENDPLDASVGKITVDRLINQEHEKVDGIKKALIYSGGARFYRALINIMQRAGIAEPWKVIVTNLFKSAQETQSLQEQNETQRLQSLTNLLLDKLTIKKEDIDKEL